MNPVQPHRSSRRWALPLTPRLSGFVDVDLPPPPPPKPKPTKTYTISRKPLPKEAIRNVGYEKTFVKRSDNKSTLNNGSQLHHDPIWYLAFSILAAILPFLFIVLGIFTAQLDGQPTSDWGSKIESAILLVPSIFPVLFAALVSKSLRTFALDRAARGTTLGNLEQLLGSGTVGSTVVTAFFLRILNVTTIVLFLVWALSPLGGQAALRMLGTQSVISERYPATVWYRSSDSIPLDVSTSAFSRQVSRIDALYLTSLLAPGNIRDQPMDTYGNLKIPYLEDFETNKADQDGWIPVQPKSENYSGLIGVPFQLITNADSVIQSELQISGEAVFTMESSYFRFDCHRPLNLSERMINKRLLNQLNIPDSENRLRGMALNLTESDYKSGRMGDRSAIIGPRKVEFISLLNAVLNSDFESTQYYSYSRCSMTTTYAESKVTCLDRRCFVSAMRRSRRQHAPESLSQLDGAGLLINHRLYNEFSAAGITRPGRHITLAERFLADPEQFWKTSSITVPDIAGVDGITFSKRLGTIFNTYWSILQSPVAGAAAGGNMSAVDPPPDIPLEKSPTIPGILKSWNQNIAPYLAERSYTEFVHRKTLYSCSWYWLATFVGSACVLAFVSLGGLILQAKRLAPDIFWVSGMTRDSSYFRTTGEAADSTLNGWNKTRRLKNMRVIIADVEPERKIGKVAFMAMDEMIGDNVNSWRKLSLGRKYL